jgi:hypothetical protein
MHNITDKGLLFVSCRRVAERRDFKRMIQRDSKILNVYVEFVKEIVSVLDELNKTSVVQVGTYLLDNFLVVTRLIQAVTLEVSSPVRSGPLRRTLVTHTSSDLLHLWPLNDRYALYTSLLHWTNVGRTGNFRMVFLTLFSSFMSCQCIGEENTTLSLLIF